MDQRVHRIARDDASLDVSIALVAAAAIILLRTVVLLGLLFGDAAIDWWLLAEVLVQLALAIAFTYGLFLRRTWGAVGLLVVWGLGYFYSWYALGRVLPPLGIIGAGIWYGLYRGLRGVRVLARYAAQEVPAA
jgi:hypothetical protein